MPSVGLMSLKLYRKIPDLPLMDSITIKFDIQKRLMKNAIIPEPTLLVAAIMVISTMTSLVGAQNRGGPPNRIGTPDSKTKSRNSVRIPSNKTQRLSLARNQRPQSVAPTIGKLGSDLAKKTKSLNPEYLVFSPKQKLKHPVPLVIYLHGAGGVGDNIQKVRGQAGQVWKGIEKYKKNPSIVVAPQASKRAREAGGWVPDHLNILLGHLKKTLKVDEKRIYLTGNSMGGYGSWTWGGHNPENFAAIAPVSGGIGPGGPKDVTPDLNKWAANLAKVPVFAFAGGKDRVVPAERSERMIAAIKKAGGKEAKIRIYPDESHGAGRVVFGSAEFYQWMFSKKRRQP